MRTRQARSIIRYDNLRWQALLLVAVALLAVAFVACSSDDEAADVGGTGATMGFGEAQSAGGAAEPANAGGFLGDKDFAREEGAPGAAITAPSSGDDSVGLGNILGRHVIRNGSVDLRVESVDEAFEAVRRVAEQAGGFVAGSSFSGQEEFQRASLTLRVPAEAFEDVIADLRDLAVRVEHISTGSQDVTEEYTDLQARLRNLQAVEQQYLTLLGEARQIGDILQVQDRLTGVRFEVEQVQGRINLLDDLTALATLEVSLTPDSAQVAQQTEPGFTDRIGDAWASSLETLADLGTGVAVVLVWSWWLIPFVAAALVVAARAARRLRRVDTPETAA